MNTPMSKALPLSQRVAVLAVAVAVALAAYALPHAQAPAKKAMTIDDYTKWRSIAGQEISPDGKWVAYTLRLTNVVAAESKPVLHLLNLETNQEVTVADATDPDFSPDSKWVAYQVDPGAAQRARAGRAGTGGSGATGSGGAPGGAPAQPGAAASQSGQAGRAGAAPADAPASGRAAQPGDRRRAFVAGHRDVRLLGHHHASVPPAARRRGAGPGGRPRRRGRAAAGRTAAGRRRPRWGDRHTGGTAGRRRGPAGPSDRAPPVARQRGRHRVQSHRRTARLHGGRRRQGRERPVRLRHANRADDGPRQRCEELQPARLERRGQCHRGSSRKRRREDAREGQRPARVPRRGRSR